MSLVFVSNSLLLQPLPFLGRPDPLAFLALPVQPTSVDFVSNVNVLQVAPKCCRVEFRNDLLFTQFIGVSSFPNRVVSVYPLNPRRSCGIESGILFSDSAQLVDKTVPLEPARFVNASGFSDLALRFEVRRLLLSSGTLVLGLTLGFGAPGEAGRLPASTSLRSRR